MLFRYEGSLAFRKFGASHTLCNEYNMSNVNGPAPASCQRRGKIHSESSEKRARVSENHWQVCSPKKLVREMYLDRHPMYLQIQDMQVGKHGDKSRKFITQALYRTDLASLFLSLKPARRHHCRALAKAMRLRPRHLAARPQGNGIDALLAWTGFEHIRTVSQSSRFYSLSRDDVCLLQVQDAMSPDSAAPPPQVVLQEEGVIFIRILHSHPSRMKTSHLPVASGGRLHPQDMAVSVHSQVGVPEAPKVVLDANSSLSDATCFLRGLGACEHAVLQRMLCWKYDHTSLSFSIRDYMSEHGADALHAALWCFLRDNVLPSTGSCPDSKHVS